MGLIDADKLLECVEVSMQNNTHRNGNAALCHVSEHRHFIETIVEQPTAFDVEKVLNELKHEESEALRRYSESKGTAYAFSDKCSCDNWAKAIEIVKRGGRDEE